MDTAIQNISIWAALKNASYVAAFFATTQYLGLLPESVAVLTALIAIDIVTGIIKSGVLYGWRSIRSSRLASGTLAKMLLVLIPMCLALAGKGVSIDMHALAQGSITVLVLSQAYSVIGNIHAVQTRTDKNEFDAVAYILRSLRDLLERFMDKTSVKPPMP
jgi:phage-related holin